MSSDIPISKPPIFKILDDDIIHVVTGYNKPGAHLASRDASMYNIKKYILDTGNIIAGNRILTEEINDYGVRIHTTGINANEGNNIEISFSQARNTGNGPPYYSATISTTGLNARAENLIVRDLETIWPYSGVIYNTGLNAIVGNNLEIQFSVTGDAAIKYGGAGGKYLSGIISTTGLNARTENLIVRDFETSWPYSGTIYNTGLNAIVGNNIEIQFSSETAASNKYGGTAGKYKSGIISTTGLNARTENLIVRDFETSWPHSGVIYNTGLNARAGNLIEIQYSSSSSAGNLYKGTEGKYFSGIISTTGLNMVDGNNIAYTIDEQFPHKYTIFTVNKAKQSWEYPITFYNNYTNTTMYSISGYIDPTLLIDYSSLYTSKTNEYLYLIATLKFLLDDNNIVFTIPMVPGLGSTNSIKDLELSAVLTVSYTDNTVPSCYIEYTDIGDEQHTLIPVCYGSYTSITDPSGGPSTDWEPYSLSIVSNTFDFTVSLSGGQSNLLAKYPISFTNIGTGLNNPVGGNFTFGSNIIYEKYRNIYATNIGRDQYSYTFDNNWYKGYSIDPIQIEYLQKLYINSNTINSQNSTCPQFNISNVMYSRTYRKLIGYSSECNNNSCSPGGPVYRYYTANGYRGSASFSIDKRYFKTENTEQ